MINLKEYTYCSGGERGDFVNKFKGKILFEQLYNYQGRLNHSSRTTRRNESYRCEGICIDYDGEEIKKLSKKFKMFDCDTYVKFIKQLEN
jgi:Mor family transcriptional regulator